MIGDEVLRGPLAVEPSLSKTPVSPWVIVLGKTASPPESPVPTDSGTSLAIGLSHRHRIHMFRPLA